jgi:ribosome-associated toxin RatA of RatAB toxin-antitoxin module
MTRLEHSVQIDRPLSDVYSLATQVDRYPEFLPGYLESRVIERRNGDLLLERKAFVKGKIRQWRSWARFCPAEAIHFEHAEGPLKGMQVKWIFTAMSPHRTQLKIIHLFPDFRVFSLAWIREKFIYRSGVNKMATQVVQSFKKACEGVLVL